MGHAEVIIPYEPRELQLGFHNRAERFAILVCHRRFGKTVAAINDLIRSAVQCPRRAPRFAYLAPLYRQAKQAAWDYLKYYTRPIPGMKYYESELRADFPNGARIALYGSDNPDALRGIYLDGVVLDEYAQMPRTLWSQVILPTLADRQGWAAFIGTPKGHNEFYDLFTAHKDDPEWYVRVFRASETSYLKSEELELQRSNMGPEEYEQEYECSWTAAIKGAYYGKLMEDADTDGRIRDIGVDPGVPVETWWDLGIGDPTSIWFVQRSVDVRVLDYYESSGESLAHYVDVLDKKKAQHKWNYGDCVVPHDVQNRSISTGQTRLTTLKSLGVDRAKVMPIHRLEDGIEAVRRLIPQCYFHPRCGAGLDALRLYKASYDERLGTLKNTPVHDWTSHAADAFRYGAMHKPSRKKWAPIDYDDRGIV